MVSLSREIKGKLIRALAIPEFSDGALWYRPNPGKTFNRLVAELSADFTETEVLKGLNLLESQGIVELSAGKWAVKNGSWIPELPQTKHS